MITFEPLWETLKTKNISIYKLINTYGLSRGTLNSLKHNKNVTLNTLNWLCEVLECDLSDVIKYIPDSMSEKNENSSGNTFPQESHYKDYIKQKIHNKNA